jgi:hypothetical protein
MLPISQTYAITWSLHLIQLPEECHLTYIPVFHPLQVQKSPHHSSFVYSRGAIRSLWYSAPGVQPGVAPCDQPGQERHAKHGYPDGSSRSKKAAEQPRAQPSAEQGYQRTKTEHAQASTTNPCRWPQLRRVRQRADEHANQQPEK